MVPAVTALQVAKNIVTLQRDGYDYYLDLDNGDIIINPFEDKRIAFGQWFIEPYIQKLNFKLIDRYPCLDCGGKKCEQCNHQGFIFKKNWREYCLKSPRFKEGVSNSLKKFEARMLGVHVI